MPDLKAAAKWLKESATDSYITDQQTGYLLLAAQALEAWAWQQEKGADVQYDIEDDSFVCDTFNGQYRRCTPLGAVLAAMEGESDGN